MKPHEHKFFMFQVKTMFEPLDGVHNTYKGVEYAYLSCACGHAIRQKVIDRLDNE